MWLSIIAMLIFIVLMAWTILSDDEGIRINIASIATLIFFVVLIILNVLTKENYKQGQIDAINGKIKYQLCTNADSTRTWHEIKE